MTETSMVKVLKTSIADALCTGRDPGWPTHPEYNFQQDSAAVGPKAERCRTLSRPLAFCNKSTHRPTDRCQELLDG